MSGLAGFSAQGGSVVKKKTKNKKTCLPVQKMPGDVGLIPGSGRSPGEGNGNPLQYSGLKSPIDKEAWQATIHGVTKSRT